METRRIGLQVLTGSLAVLFALTITPIHLLVFAQIHIRPLPPPSSSAATAQLQPPIPKSIPKQQPNMTLQGSPGLTANGSIGSIIYLSQGLRYVADGKWDLVDNGSRAYFSVNMTWYPNTPTNSTISRIHTHAIQNFQLQGQRITQVQPNNIIIKGVADVLTNREVKWHNIPISIKIAGNVLDISFTGNDRNSIIAKAHFGGQDTLGVVKAITECSDQPLPNMQILPDCSSLPSTTTTTTASSSSTDNGIPPFVPPSSSGTTK
jgi:hypothetical protein